MTKTNEMKRVLRTAGIDTKFVKISHRYCGYDESYSVRLYDKSIDLKKVEELLRSFRAVSYDEYCGEILLGGNTYLWVQYDWSIR